MMRSKNDFEFFYQKLIVFNFYSIEVVIYVNIWFEKII